MKKILVVVNPISGNGTGLKLLDGLKQRRAVISALAKAAGAEAPAYWPVLYTTPDQTWKQEFKTYLQAGPTSGDLVGVMAIGGDGTLSEVAAILYEEKSELSLVPVPGGRGNDFVRGLFGYSAGNGNYWDWADTHGGWDLKKLDLGSANGRVYLNMASLGFGGRVVENTHGRHALWSNTKMVYQVEGALAFLESAFKARNIKCEVKSDGNGVYNGLFFGAFVGNGKANGHGLYWTKDAIVDDGKLDAVVFARPGMLNMVRSLNAVKGKNLPTFEHVSTQAREIVFHFDRPVPLELDGEFISTGLTHEFQCLPRVLNAWVLKL